MKLAQIRNNETHFNNDLVLVSYGGILFDFLAFGRFTLVFRGILLGMGVGTSSDCLESLHLELLLGFRLFLLLLFYGICSLL